MPLNENLTGRNLKGFFQKEGHFEFNVFIYFYNPESGLFIAKGYDKFGESGLIGAVYEEWSETGPIVKSMGYTIKFHKNYAGIPLNRDGLFRNDSFYKGDFCIDNGRVYCSGEFKLNKDDDFEGTWELQSAE